MNKHSDFSEDYFKRIKDYSQRNNINFPHHFGEFLLFLFDEIDNCIEGMKEGALFRIKELERKANKYCGPYDN